MKVNSKKLAVSAMLVAVTVSLSGFSIPIGASRCFPAQHLANVVAGVFLGQMCIRDRVMDAVLKETEVEFYTVAEEIKEYNPALLAYIEESLPGVERRMVPHTGLKELSRQVKCAIRTGEFTPYPNIILRAGVAFPV